ncbi:hypothetical protein TRVA0_015S00298 [Trichomonascus vanleenenianus]|uniref:uncharacterized protein n=1 Tax=Trichomonascus vanleenenianus TaxID=2268995 RepID=UPI003ECAB7DD
MSTTSSVPNKSQFSPSKWDLIRVTANRFTYSKEYIVAYVLLTILSIITVSLSLATPTGCPHITFYIFEIIILIALLLEVGIRMVALRRFFWKSWWNVADAFLMIICVITLALVFAGCSKNVRIGRRAFTSLLIIRNGVQIVRMVNLIWRNSNNINNRQIDIDLDQVQDSGFILLPEEENELDPDVDDLHQSPPHNYSDGEN